MKKQILSLIFLMCTLIGFSQTMPTLAKTSNLTPITINNNDTLLVPVGDSVWIGNIDVWNFNFFGDPNGNHFYLHKSDIAWTAVTTIDTVVIGNNDKFRFNVPIMTKYRYVIRREFMTTQDITFYVRGTTSITTGIASNSLSKSTLNAYPNPATDELTLTFNTSKHDDKIELFDIQGRSVLANTDERETGQNTVKLDVSQLNAGIYFARVGSDTFKITKQ